MTNPHAGRSAEDLLEDLLFLVQMGEHPENVAKRLGYANVRNLSRRLYLMHRPDVVHVLIRNDRLVTQ